MEGFHIVRNIHYGWDNSIKPAIEVSSGEILEIEVRDSLDGQITKNSNASDLNKLDFNRVNPLTGPIYIRDAHPGDFLEVDIIEVKDNGTGITSVVPGFGLLSDIPEFSVPALKNWEIREDSAYAEFGELKIKVGKANFIGTIGTALKESGNFSVVPPRYNGGNMDVKEIRSGSKLVLPVNVDGALLSLGDMHINQGNGEVCGTAIETGGRVRLKINLLKNVKYHGPLVISDGGRSYSKSMNFLGISDSLNIAMREAILNFVSFFSKYMEPIEAYMLASVALDLKISETVDMPNYVVNASFPIDIVMNEEYRRELENLGSKL